MSLANVDIDITGYTGKKDFQALTSYISENTFALTLKRLDSAAGWIENMKVLLNFKTLDKTMTIVVGKSQQSLKTIEVETTFKLERGTLQKEYDNYDIVPAKNIQRISREKFNELFDTDVVVLPHFLFAVGIKNKNVYMYNETYEFLYMIELTINSILSVALTQNTLRMFYFVINAGDGYMEHHYPAIRNSPRRILENEYIGKKQVEMISDHEYPVLHKDEYVLAQSIHPLVKNTVDVPDRYYFCLNRYNEYRSFHKGQPFSKKINKIVFASNPRGTKFNFKNRRDIHISQREYFYSDAVPKDNIFCPSWIEKEEMVNYKYVLDIDGNASTWDATAWKLNSGSVILKTESCWSQWFYANYKEWVHYVPIKDDFSDIQEKYQWCESNQQACVIMIENCKQLFQEAFRYNNVMKYINHTILKINNLDPYFVDGKRLFITSFDKFKYPNIKMTTLSSEGGSTGNLKAIHTMCNRLNDDDVIVYLRSENTDVSDGFKPEDFLKRYSSLNAKIVFGAEKNLWPGEIESLRYKLDNMSPNDSAFKYLNAGFFCAEVKELRKLLDEQIYEGNEFIDQAYFNKILLTGAYSLGVDYKQSLVVNTYLCTKEEIVKFQKSTLFIHFNAGR